MSERALARTALLTAGCAILLSWNVLLVSAMVTKLHMNDFGKFYYSAKFFLSGSDMYQPSPASWIPISNATNVGFLNMNPPHLHLAILPLAYLSPNRALLVWFAMSGVCLATVLVLIRKEVAIRLGSRAARLGAVGAFLGFSGTGMVMVTGQLSFLMALLLTLSWLAARRGKWRTAGVYLGVLASIKPFLLIFIPYLCMRRRRDAVVTAAVAFVGCFTLGFLIFGLAPHQEWIRTLGSVGWEWAAMNGSLAGLLHRTLAPSPVFVPIVIAPLVRTVLWTGGIGVIALVTFFVSWRGESRSAVDRAFTILVLGALLISPLGWIYYLWLAVGPMTALFGVTSSRPSGTNLPTWLLRGAGLLLFVPVHATVLLQPSVAATATIASVYSWALLMLWLAIVLDWWAVDRRKNDVARCKVAYNDRVGVRGRTT
jgi:hypothetical protein